jgi:hypothetical protein
MWFLDPFRLAVAILPLAVYLLLLARLNLSRRPFLTTGGRDLGALGTALAGLVVIGPIELFMPQMAALKFGAYVWLPLIAFYGLWVSLIVLLARPRLIIYNIGLDELRPVLADVVARIDPGARWAGDTLVLSQKKKTAHERGGTDESEAADEGQAAVRITQLHIDVSPAMRHIAMVANGPRQSFTLWRQLEIGLAAGLRDVSVRPNACGWCLLSTALLLVAGCMGYMLDNPQAVAQGMQDMLAR